MVGDGMVYIEQTVAGQHHDGVRTGSGGSSRIETRRMWWHSQFDIILVDINCSIRPRHELYSTSTGQCHNYMLGSWLCHGGKP